MRTSIALFVVAAAGVVLGAALIGVWAVGLAVIADSVALAAYALLRDAPEPARPAVSPVAEILERGRRVS